MKFFLTAQAGQVLPSFSAPPCEYFDLLQVDLCSISRWIWSTDQTDQFVIWSRDQTSLWISLWKQDLTDLKVLQLWAVRFWDQHTIIFTSVWIFFPAQDLTEVQVFQLCTVRFCNQSTFIIVKSLWIFSAAQDLTDLQSFQLCMVRSWRQFFIISH